MLEENLQRALVLSKGKFLTFVATLVSALFLALALLLIAVVTIPAMKAARSQAA